MRRREKKRVGGRRRGEVHRWCQIRPETPTGVAVFDDEIHRSHCVSSGEAKGERGRCIGAIYSRLVPCIVG
jgi:hypothetical protein